MKQYTQLQELERVRIYEGLKQGWGPTKIAASIGRNKSSVSRELRRNSDRIGYLYPRDAHHQAQLRKAQHGSKIERNPAMKAYIMEKLQERWSPVIIAGRWSKENPAKSITAEAIYQWIYNPKNKAQALWKLLAKARVKRGMRRRKQHPVGGIMHRVSIHKRPEEINTRKDIGHYEADLMFNQGSQAANVLTLVERKSRMVTLVKHESKHSKPIIESIEKKIGTTALSCTFDNGKEFALHHTLKIPTFFCDPASPWQKGSVENMNGLARTYIPFSLEPKQITQEYLDSVCHTMNNKPRKSLNFLTPYEVFNNHGNPPPQSRVKPAAPDVEASFYQNL
jgi:IS30 family transposase